MFTYAGDLKLVLNRVIFIITTNYKDVTFALTTSEAYTNAPL